MESDPAFQSLEAFSEKSVSSFSSTRGMRYGKYLLTFQRYISQPTKQNAKQKVEEIDRFVGRGGAIFLMLVLPVAIQAFHSMCINYQCSEIPVFYGLLLGKPISDVLTLLPVLEKWHLQLAFGFWGFSWLLHVLLPGRIAVGWPTRNGVLAYKLNGLLCLAVSWLGYLAAYRYGLFSPLMIINNMPSLVLAYQCIAQPFVLFLWLRGRFSNSDEHSGDILIDYFFGYQQNPRLFDMKEIDVKFFTETRALICWGLVDITAALCVYEDLHTLTWAMSVVLLAQLGYIVHAFYYESNLLTQVDFIAENMGWMLGWGNMVMVSTGFSLPAVYAYHNRHDDISPLFALALTAIFILARQVFEQANQQKHRFKQNPAELIWGEPAKVIKASGGRQLLVSGWWGVARKVNYTADLVIALVFGLTAGRWALVPFMYLLYLTLLLIHRQYRDDEWCHGKYGAAWVKYRKAVPYRLIPYVY